MITPNGQPYREEPNWPWPGEPWPWCLKSARYEYPPSGGRGALICAAIPHDAHIVNEGNTVCPGVVDVYVVEELP